MKQYYQHPFGGVVFMTSKSNKMNKQIVNQINEIRGFVGYQTLSMPERIQLGWLIKDVALYFEKPNEAKIDEWFRFVVNKLNTFTDEYVRGEGLDMVLAGAEIIIKPIDHLRNRVRTWDEITTYITHHPYPIRNVKVEVYGAYLRVDLDGQYAFLAIDQLHDFPWEQTAEQLKQHISNKAW